VQKLRRVALETILKAIPAGVVVIEKENGKVSYVNNRAIELYGVDPRGLEMPNHSTKLMKLLTLNGEVYPPEKLPASKALLTGEEAKDDLIIERPDSSRVIVFASATPIRDKKGEVVAAVGIFEDITERKKAEETLKKQVSLIDLSPDAIIVKKIDDTITFWSQGAQRLYGWTKEEAIGQKSRLLLKTKFPEPYEEILNKLNCNGRWSGEKIHQNKFGREIIVDSRWLATSNVQGKIGEIFETNVDITERKTAEKDLVESEERFRLVAEAAKFLVYEFDIEKDIISVSRGMELLGYKPDEKPLITNDWWMSQIHPDDRLAIEAKLNKAIETATDTLFEYRIRCKQGDYIIVHDTVKMIKNQQGKVTRIIGGVRDVTEWKKLQAQLEEYAKNLETLVEERTKQLKGSERMATIGQTAGMVGHDIRNPLQAITGDLYLLKEELKGIPEGENRQAMQENLGAIDENITYINKIVSDLQDYTRPLKPNIEKLNLKDLIDSTLIVANVPEKITTQVIADENLLLNTEATFIRRVLTNLIVNAIQAMPNGGKLTIEAHTKKDKAIISVKDTGVGIPEEVKPNLFKPLFTTKSKGQGLGLAVIKRLVEDLNGKVNFESEEDKGTKFIIELPLTAENHPSN